MSYLQKLRKLGLDVMPGPEGLIRVSPAELVTPELRQEIVRHKPQILRELAGQPSTSLWRVRVEEGRISLVEPCRESPPAGEWVMREIEVPHQGLGGGMDVWNVAERVGFPDFILWFVERREDQN